MAVNNPSTIQENYEALLLAYAAGILDQAQNFAVSVHLSLSPRARQFVRKYETIGGALIECACDPEPMKSGSLENVLAQLDKPQRPVQQKPQQRKAIPVRLPPEINIPIAILETISCRPCEPRWRTALPGIHMCDLPMECRKSTVHFIKGRPDARIPHHTHRGMEITLVLDGAFMDDFGHHQRGDMVVLDETVKHETGACREQGVVAMVVSAAPVRFTGLASLLNPFLRF